MSLLNKVSPSVTAKLSAVILVVAFVFGWMAFPVALRYIVSKSGKKTRGRPRITFFRNLENTLDCRNYNSMKRMAEDRWAFLPIDKALPLEDDDEDLPQITLYEGTDSRNLWIQLPTFDFRVYFFNVTNFQEVHSGGKPDLQEIGPFCYKEIKEKVGLIEDDEDDTISYTQRVTWYREQTIEMGCDANLTGEEMVTIPNVALLSVLLIAEKDFPVPALVAVNQALPSIYGRMKNIFLTTTVNQLLFDGIVINCSSSLLFPRAVCIAIEQNSRALEIISKSVYKFSFFGVRNATVADIRYTVKRSINSGQQIGRLVEYNGKPQLPYWRGECNKLLGTDGTIFPPFRTESNNSIVVYSYEICRVVTGRYEGDKYYKGIHGYHYTVGIGDTNDPSERCYCTSQTRCPKFGILDVFQCIGAPIIASLPHFLESDEDYLNAVKGLRPDKEKHQISLTFEPTTGTPLIVRKRLQFNIEMRKINFIDITSKLRRTVVPLFWVEEALDLDDELIGLLESSLFLPVRAVNVLVWMSVGTGSLLMATAVALKIRIYRLSKITNFSDGANNDAKDNGNIKENEDGAQPVNTASVKQTRAKSN